jgi:hypothetical protein
MTSGNRRLLRRDTDPEERRAGELSAGEHPPRNDRAKRKENEMTSITTVLSIILLTLLRLALPFGLLLYFGERYRRHILQNLNQM